MKYKFYKGSSKARGSGIGLAVCEEIISRHNGELIISNAEDEAGGCLVDDPPAHWNISSRKSGQILAF